MPIIRIILDTTPAGPPSYEQVDAALERMGYLSRIPATHDGKELWYALPVGTWWTAEERSAEDLLADAKLALHAADELGAQVVCCSGDTAWWGLEIVEVVESDG